MRFLVHQLIEHGARRHGNRTALTHKGRSSTYEELWDTTRRFAGGLAAAGLQRTERVGIYLEKSLENVVAMFGTAACGGVYVPINPLLRPQQVAYIMRDCGVRMLVTSTDRLAALDDALSDLPELRSIIVVDDASKAVDAPTSADLCRFEELTGAAPLAAAPPLIDADLAAILYTSGTTGMPKGVVLSHRNIVVGGKSVSSYLENHAEDRILAVLPLSFDAGMSQLTTGFCVGAEVILLNYLMPRDVVRACEKHRVTGLTCVPPLWIKLAEESWTDGARAALRYFANTGGHMPRPTLDALRSIFTHAAPYLMYGLTEAFRSTYLPPAEVDRRPDSMGKAIPNAEILVIGPDGQECGPGEVGELVHRGALVSLGYWDDPELTAVRFRPAPGQPAGIPTPEIAVWSGDLVRRDEAGFLYFVGRNDEMIKTSGYRVSPTEIEEVIMQTGLVAEAVALGLPHEELGHRIVVAAVPRPDQAFDGEQVLAECRNRLPRYMVPHEVVAMSALPRNNNGKIDRKLVKQGLLADRPEDSDGPGNTAR